jgi:hypothetical protein
MVMGIVKRTFRGRRSISWDGRVALTDEALCFCHVREESRP